MEELCCLAAAGELSAIERSTLDRHVAECLDCRELLADMEHIALFDLSVAAAVRMENQNLDDLDISEENRIFEQLVQRVQNTGSHREDWIHHDQETVPSCSPSISRRISSIMRKTYPVAGWAVAAALCTWAVLTRVPKRIAPAPQSVSISAPDGVSLEVERWKTRALAAENRADEEKLGIARAESQSAAAAAAVAHATADYDKLLLSKKALETQLSTADVELRQQASDLTTARLSVEEERSKEENLQAELHEVNLRLERQKSEVAHLQEVSSTISHTPVSEQAFKDADAREIFGARDLHIVDVYDVDHAGKASRIYGRVYYVNHNLLLFYAFDLAGADKSKKAVAFQAWGFRQPNSTSVQSLGLFYMDDAKQDRWVLRISDPQILARIDTLFVTAEPPGGSNSPKGRQVLLASLAGPANHP